MDAEKQIALGQAKAENMSSGEYHRLLLKALTALKQFLNVQNINKQGPDFLLITHIEALEAAVKNRAEHQ